MSEEQIKDLIGKMAQTHLMLLQEGFDVNDEYKKAFELIDKQISEKPILNEEGRLVCPTCKSLNIEIYFYDDWNMLDIYENYNFCQDCGKKLDNSEREIK